MGGSGGARIRTKMDLIKELMGRSPVHVSNAGANMPLCGHDKDRRFAVTKTSATVVELINHTSCTPCLRSAIQYVEKVGIPHDLKEQRERKRAKCQESRLRERGGA